MVNALQVEMARSERAVSPIPPITDPMGRNWNQPDRANIEIDDTHALMTKRVFDALKEYSSTNPTGAYAGKMWRRHDGAYDRDFIAGGGKPEWMLCWFGYCKKPECPGCSKFVSNNYRLILIADGEAEANVHG